MIQISKVGMPMACISCQNFKCTGFVFAPSKKKTLAEVKPYKQQKTRVGICSVNNEKKLAKEFCRNYSQEPDADVRAINKPTGETMNTQDWIKNTGQKPKVPFVSVRFDNCKSSDPALEKEIDCMHVDELEWHLKQNGAEVTSYKPVSISFEDIHKNKIYCGTACFAAIKKEMNVLYGNAFKFKNVTFVQDENLHPTQIITLDRELKQILKELENKYQENSHGN